MAVIITIMFISVGKERCFKHLQDVIVTCLWCDVHRTTLSQSVSFPAHLFDLKWRLKSSEDKVVSQREIKTLLCFVAESWGEKCQNDKFFYPRARLIVIYSLQLTRIKLYFDASLIQRKHFSNNEGKTC